MTTDCIYIAPNIRTQTLEKAEAFIERKRVARLILASSYQQTVKEKATKLHGKNAMKFEKGVEAFNIAMQQVIDSIEKLQKRLQTLADIHSETVNIETVLSMEDEK